MTKLCHIKRDHVENFYISLEKHEQLRYCCTGMTISIKFGTVMRNSSLKCILIPKIQDDRQTPF